MASRHGHFDIAHLLIDHGAEVNTKMGHLTALHLASHNDYFKALLERGAHVHERAEAGRTPLPMTVMCGHWDIMHAIIEGVSRARHSGLLRRMGSLYRVGRYILRPQKQGAYWGHGPALEGYIKGRGFWPMFRGRLARVILLFVFHGPAFTFILQAASRRHRGVAITSMPIRIDQVTARGQPHRLIWHGPERALPCSTSPAAVIDLSLCVSPFSPFTLLMPLAEP